MRDITREGGTVTYQEAVMGENGGVNRNNSSMNHFLGEDVLPELLVEGKVGVYVDRGRQDPGTTLLESRSNMPYLYTYTAESILSWTYGPDQELEVVLLEDTYDILDPDTGLTVEIGTRYRMMKRNSAGIEVTFYDADGDPIIDDSELAGTLLLNLPRIPFVIFEISQSLLVDIADQQVALTNLVSADMNYCTRSGFPIYVEQFNPLSNFDDLRKAEVPRTGVDGGVAAEAPKASPQEISVGVAQGRRYPKNLEAPSFIHPSAEPLIASMQKQEQIKRDIRQNINLALTNIDPKRASAESKQVDERGLEAGLSYIGLVLQHGEMQLAELWARYEQAKEIPVITYPSNYSLRTDEQRAIEADGLLDMIPKLPSKTYQKVLAKRAAGLIIGHRVATTTLKTVENEIDAAQVVDIDPDRLLADREAGLVSTDLVSTARQYPDGEVEKASKDHAERLASIQAAQTSPEDSVNPNPAARGIPDGAVTPTSDAKEE